MKPLLVINPASAGGRTGRHFDRVVRAVRGAVGDFDHAFTSGRGDGAALAREAVRAGVELVVAVGGDGTASEVVDGLVGEVAAGGPQATFGFLPRGTGGDLKRTLGWPADLDAAARVLATGVDRLVDVGRIEFTGHDGRPAARHFANVAGCGVSGCVVQRVDAAKLLGGRAAFMVAAARALAGWRDQAVRWRLDGGEWNEGRVTALSVCNGRYFGGGMLVAPRAAVDDGILDVVIWSGLGLREFALRKAMLYDGTHVRLPNTRCLRARLVEVEPLGGERVLLDVDGEQPGTLPARFAVLPGALRARVPNDG